MKQIKRLTGFMLIACISANMLVNTPIGTIFAAEQKKAVEEDSIVGEMQIEVATSTDMEVVNEANVFVNITNEGVQDVIETSELDFEWDGTTITKYIGNDEKVVIPHKCRTIGKSAFEDCKFIRSIEILEGVTSIDCLAFAGCSNLTKIVIPTSVTSIKESVFWGCRSLESIIIPSGVTEIGDYLFDGCVSLSSITIPDSVTSIGKAAFSDCSSLKSVTIPNSITALGEAAFWGCSNLTQISLPDGVDVIGESLFQGCSNLKDVTIPSSVTTIGDSAFDGCECLKNIIIPESVVRIGDSAFDDCRSLESIIIPNCVKSIEGNPFRGCSGLVSVIVADENGIYDSRGNCNAIIETETNKLIAGCMNTIIPNSISAIGDSAFYACESLRDITIPASVTTIGDSAFDGCSGLSSIVVMDGVKTLGESVFGSCSSLTSIILPNSVTSMGKYAFQDCVKLINARLPESIKMIGDSAFDNCSNLTSITIPKGVAQIGDFAFSECSSLKSITIPESVKYIGENVFLGCNSLKNITIPVQVTSIGCNAFDKGIMIYGKNGSYVEDYAKMNGYTFVDLSLVVVPDITNLKAVPVGINKVKVTWNKVNGAIGYIVYAKKNGVYAKIGITASTSYTDTKALDNAYNFYFVYAYKKDSADKVVVGKCPKYTYAKGTCMAVTNLKTSSVKNGVKITWTKSVGADGYLVYGKRTSKGKYGYIGMTSDMKNTYTDRLALKNAYSFYWVFPYHYDTNGKMVVGPICGYVFGKAK